MRRAAHLLDDIARIISKGQLNMPLIVSLFKKSKESISWMP